MAVKIRERIPARTLRLSDTGQYEPQLDLMVGRFMGVLMHPVLRSEMGRLCDLDRRRCKVLAVWPANAPDDHPVKAGDVLQIEDRSCPIRGVNEHPRCYLELYVDEAC
ncbi:MAG: hypothetical protein JOZ41_07290 [Chloroflexi bacterium]|nr:hypothetical protein [Chloroflexota bacterium]